MHSIDRSSTQSTSAKNAPRVAQDTSAAPSEQALCEQALYALHKQRLAREISSEEIARSVLERIQQVEHAVHAYIRLAEGVLAAAVRADERIAAGEEISPLEGMPIAVKDIFSTQGMPTTCGSRILESYTPPYDATVVARLKEQGFNMVGKTNMDEFAMGSSTEHSAYGPTRNPWDLTRAPGGSSGGSAAAVAAGEALAAIGTDTGGSIRQPAALTGVVGLKPSYGRVSRFGMIAFASSLDTAGVLTRDVRDAALLLQTIAGADAQDSTSVRQPVEDYLAAPQADLKGLRIGVVREFMQAEGLDAEVAATVQAALETLRDLGAELREVSLPHQEYAVPVYYILAPSEASSNLSRYDGVRYGLRTKEAQDLATHFERSRGEGFGEEVKRRILMGTFALSAGYYDAYYLRAMRLRATIREDFRRVFEEVSLIVGPTTPTTAFPLGEQLEAPLRMYLQDQFTLPANLAGIPGLSLPAGFSTQGLPVGLQLLAPHFQETRLFQVGCAFQQATAHHKRRPPIVKAAAQAGSVATKPR